MANTDEKQSLRSCAMTVDDLELLLGRDLFPLLDDSVEEQVESTIDHQVWK